MKAHVFKQLIHTYIQIIIIQTPHLYIMLKHFIVIKNHQIINQTISLDLITGVEILM